MEVSHDRNGRCSRVPGTDFSIDSILRRRSSAEGGRRTALPPPPVQLCVQAQPNWLFCSRYQPPKIPRGGGGGSRSRRAGRHARVPFTAAQSTALESAFERAPYLAPPALRALAHALQLREDRIKIWFQNRRARERREKSTLVPPPQTVTIPATTHTRLFSAHAQTFADFLTHTQAERSYEQIEQSNECSPEYLVEDGRESPVDVETVEETPTQMPLC